VPGVEQFGVRVAGGPVVRPVQAEADEDAYLAATGLAVRAGSSESNLPDNALLVPARTTAGADLIAVECDPRIITLPGTTASLATTDGPAKYGYPPDAEPRAIELVLQQTRTFAEEWSA
jgi:hypothetical protein